METKECPKFLFCEKEYAAKHLEQFSKYLWKGCFWCKHTKNCVNTVNGSPLEKGEIDLSDRSQSGRSAAVVNANKAKQAELY